MVVGVWSIDDDDTLVVGVWSIDDDDTLGDACPR